MPTTMASKTIRSYFLFFYTILVSTTHGDIFNGSHIKRIDEEVSSYTPLLGVGVNMVNVFWERLQHVLGEGEDNDDTNDEVFVNGKNPKHSFVLLKSKGIDLVRFAASPYCQSQFSMWRLGGEQEALYWSILDDIMSEAYLAGVRLIPTLIWRAKMPSLACQEPFSMLFNSEKTSCARSLIRLYATQLVSRYEHYDNIVAWELFNELNLVVDLSHKAKGSKCYWDMHKKKKVCTTPVKVASIHSINSTLPLLSKQEVNEMSTLGPQCLSTVRESSHACNCSGNKISNADDFSSDEMFNFYRDYAGWVREADVVLQRPISSGQAMPRASAWHLAHDMAQSKWKTDSSKQFCEHLLDTHAHVELASIHPYIHTKPGTNGSSLGDEVVLRLDGRSVGLFELVRIALRCINEANRPYPRQLYIGEFGFRQGNNVSLAFVRRVLDMVREEASMEASMETSMRVRTPPLITLWVYEFKPQHQGLSIESSRDGWLLNEISTANKLARSRSPWG